MKTAHLTCAAFAALLFSLPAGAETMRCTGGYLVQIGNSKTDVLQHCGDPIARDAFCSPSASPSAQPAGGSTCVNVEEWTYNPGSGQFMTTLRFVEGQLRAIRYGNRVP